MDGLRPVFVFMVYHGSAAWGNLCESWFQAKKSGELPDSGSFQISGVRFLSQLTHPSTLSNTPGKPG